MSDEMYGAKCHRCADLLGPTHDVAPITWLRSVRWLFRCPDCSFCQERALASAIQDAGLGIFDPEVRKAVHAFQRGESHPLIDQLRGEMSRDYVEEPEDEQMELEKEGPNADS